MKNLSYVCAHDPASPQAVGTVVSDVGRVRKDTARGVHFLPIDEHLVLEQRLGGFVRRTWGEEGWLYDLGRGEGGCPIAIQARAGFPYIHWVAEIRQGSKLSNGKLQLWVDQSSVSTLNSGLAVVSAPDAFNMDVGQPPYNYLRGVSRFNSTIDGFLGLGLWGVCKNVRVMWMAVSQCSREA